MPTLVTTTRGTGVLDTETRRVRDVAPALAQLEPDAGPLVTLMAKLRSKVTVDPKIEWFEDELLPRFDKLDAALTASATTMTVVNYKYFRSGDLVRINKNEIARVTATPTTTAVTIKRGVGEVTGTAASANDQLHILSNSNQEGATRRALLSTQRVPVFNYCQIMRHPFGYTETARATKTFAGQDEEGEQAKQLIEHKKDIEHMCLLGQRNEDVSGTHPERTSRGIIRYITTNVTDAGGELTEPEFEDSLRTSYRYGSATKLLFCSPKLITVINGFARGKLKTVSGDKSYGITLTQYESAGRKVLLHEHRLLTNDSLNDLTGIAGYGILLDIEDLMMRYMRGRMTTLKTNVQANDADERIDEYLSEVGLEAHQERKHGLLKGVTS